MYLHHHYFIRKSIKNNKIWPELKDSINDNNKIILVKR